MFSAKGDHLAAGIPRQAASEDGSLCICSWLYISPAYIDVSIVTALSREDSAAGAANHDGGAAELAAKGKHRGYPLIAVTRFIVDNHGRIGTEALSFLRRIAPDPGQRSQAMREFYQRLRALLQRYAADAVLSATRVARGRGPDSIVVPGSVVRVGSTPAVDIRLPVEALPIPDTMDTSARLVSLGLRFLYFYFGPCLKHASLDFL